MWVSSVECPSTNKKIRMKKDCECHYCKGEVDEYFCIKCKLNFNKCESFHECDGYILCPRCHPKNWIFSQEYVCNETSEKNKFNVLKDIFNDLEIE